MNLYYLFPLIHSTSTPFLITDIIRLWAKFFLFLIDQPHVYMRWVDIQAMRKPTQGIYLMSNMIMYIFLQYLS